MTCAIPGYQNNDVLQLVLFKSNKKGDQLAAFICFEFILLSRGNQICSVFS